MKDWVRMPSFWLRNKEVMPLAGLRWSGPHKSDRIAALMIYMVLVHHANDQPTAQFPDTGWVTLTYTQLCDITGLSRSKVAGGLEVLERIGCVEVSKRGRNNSYYIADYGTRGGWAKLPARRLYTPDLQRIPAFHALKLRSRVELDALKLYLIIIAMRDNATNYAVISYDRMCEYTGLARNHVKPALSLLVTQALIHVDHGATEVNQFSTKNMYRPRYLDPYRHRGTTSRISEGLVQ